MNSGASASATTDVDWTRTLVGGLMRSIATVDDLCLGSEHESDIKIVLWRVREAGRLSARERGARTGTAGLEWTTTVDEEGPGDRGAGRAVRTRRATVAVAVTVAVMMGVRTVDGGSVGGIKIGKAGGRGAAVEAGSV